MASFDCQDSWTIQYSATVLLSFVWNLNHVDLFNILLRGLIRGYPCQKERLFMPCAYWIFLCLKFFIWSYMNINNQCRYVKHNKLCSFWDGFCSWVKKILLFRILYLFKSKTGTKIIKSQCDEWDFKIFHFPTSKEAKCIFLIHQASTSTFWHRNNNLVVGTL